MVLEVLQVILFKLKAEDNVLHLYCYETYNKDILQLEYPFHSGKIVFNLV